MVEHDDTPDTLAQKVHLLEYEHFPRIIEEVVNSAQQNLQNHR
jgi:phosphoribosylglycinamide formyltransferase-1